MAINYRRSSMPGAAASLRGKIEGARRSLDNESRRMRDLRETAADIMVVSGKFPVNNVGEAYKNIVFPTIFTDIPSLGFGYEIDGDSNLKASRAPVISAALYGWDVIDRPPVSRYYRGAKILVVSEGPPNIRFIVHWQATGIGFMGPLS